MFDDAGTKFIGGSFEAEGNVSVVCNVLDAFPFKNIQKYCLTRFLEGINLS